MHELRSGAEESQRVWLLARDPEPDPVGRVQSAESESRVHACSHLLCSPSPPSPLLLFLARRRIEGQLTSLNGVSG